MNKHHTNQVKEEDERKFAIGGTVGCLTFIVIAFVGILVTFILFYFFMITAPQA